MFCQPRSEAQERKAPSFPSAVLYVPVFFPTLRPRLAGPSLGCARGTQRRPQRTGVSEAPKGSAWLVYGLRGNIFRLSRPHPPGATPGEKGSVSFIALETHFKCVACNPSHLAKFSSRSGRVPVPAPAGVISRPFLSFVLQLEVSLEPRLESHRVGRRLPSVHLLLPCIRVASPSPARAHPTH